MNYFSKTQVLNASILTWAPNTPYTAGDLVKDPGDNSQKYMYEATLSETKTSSLEGAMPTFPLVVGGTIQEGTGANQITWKAMNPFKSDDTDQEVTSGATYVPPIPITVAKDGSVLLYAESGKLSNYLTGTTYLGTTATVGKFDVDVRNYFGSNGNEIPLFPRPKAYQITLMAKDSASTTTTPTIKVKKDGATTDVAMLSLGGVPNSQWRTLTCTVPCDIRGGFILEYQAGGNLTADLKITGILY